MHVPVWLLPQQFCEWGLACAWAPRAADAHQAWISRCPALKRVVIPLFDPSRGNADVIVEAFRRVGCAVSVVAHE